MKKNKYFSRSRYLRVDPNAEIRSLFNNKTLYESFGEIENKNVFIEEPLEYYSSELELSQILVADILDSSSYENRVEPIKIKKQSKDFQKTYRGNAAVLLSYLFKLNSKKISNVIFVPWIRGGGADLHVISLCKTLQYTGRNVLIIISETSDNEWITRLPTNAIVLDLSKIWRNIPFDHLAQILYAYLKYIDVKTFHVMNCFLGWSLIKKYGKFLKSKFKIAVSLFCYDYNQIGEPFGYARLMQRVASYIDLIISDNKRFIDILDYQYSVKLFSQCCVYPHLFDHVKFKPHNVKAKKFIWASRFDVQKNIEAIIDIARLNPEVEFHIYGAPLLDGENELHRKIVSNQTGLNNIQYQGRFNGYESIDTSGYSGMIYTSIWDGLPNIVMESLSGGLPTIAPKIGGIGTELPEPHIYLVNDSLDISGFTNHINNILSLSQEHSDKKQIAARGYIDHEFSLVRQLEIIKNVGY